MSIVPGIVRQKVDTALWEIVRRSTDEAVRSFDFAASIAESLDVEDLDKLIEDAIRARVRELLGE